MSYHFSQRINTNGLVLYLDAANTRSFVSGSTAWNDLSQRGNNATLINGPVYNPSNYGNIVFDGINDEGIFPVLPDFFFLNRSPYTLSIFAKIITASGTFHGLLNREFGAPRNGYNMWFIRDNPTTVAVASERFGGTGQKIAFVILNNAQSINVWNNFCATYDGNTLSFYYNGVFTNSVFADGNITNTTGTLQIARRQTTNGNVAVSSVQIYNRALSATEVAQNYNTMKPRLY